MVELSPSINDTLAEQAAASMADAATQRGVEELMEKITPLIQGKRFHNVVDLLSMTSDVIDMADDAMIQKLMKGYDDAIGGAWTLGNAARYAQNEAGRLPVPTLIGLAKAVGSPDARRGLHFVILFLSVLGRQIEQAKEE